MLQHEKGGVSTLLTSRSVVGNEITLSCQRKVISLKYYNTPPKIVCNPFGIKGLSWGGCWAKTLLTLNY